MINELLLFRHKNGIAGAAAGVMTAFLTCPLDVLRTRMQVQHLMHDQPKSSGLVRMSSPTSSFFSSLFTLVLTDVI